MQCSLEARAPHQTDSAPALRWLCDLSPKCTWHFQAETLPSDQASSCVAWSSGNKTKKQGLHREDTLQAEINWFWRRTQRGRWSSLCSDEVGELRDHYRQDLGVWITTTRFHRQDRGTKVTPCQCISHFQDFPLHRTSPFQHHLFWSARPLCQAYLTTLQVLNSSIISIKPSWVQNLLSSLSSPSTGWW